MCLLCACVLRRDADRAARTLQLQRGTVQRNKQGDYVARGHDRVALGGEAGVP